MRHLALTLVATILLGCGRSNPSRSSEKNRSIAATGLPSGGMTPLEQRQKSKETDSPAVAPSRAEADRMLNRTFGDLAQHTGEEERVVSFVERYLDATKNPFPRPRKYLVAKPKEHWIVTVLDLDSLRRGGRPGELVVHVVDDKGHLRVLKMEAR